MKHSLIPRSNGKSQFIFILLVVFCYDVVGNFTLHEFISYKPCYTFHKYSKLISPDIGSSNLYLILSGCEYFGGMGMFLVKLFLY